MFDDVATLFSSGDWWPVAARIGIALFIVAGAILATKLLHMWIERLRRQVRNTDAASVLYVIEKIGGYIVIVVGLLMALSQLGVNLESFSLFAGALGVGVGLGLQGVVKEFFSGLQLIFNPAVRVGDFVQLEDGTRGEVVEIGTRSTRLRTNDDLAVLIPNSEMVSSRVTNWTSGDMPPRIHVPFSVSETADKANVRQVVLAAAHALPFTQRDSENRKTQVWLVGFGGNGLDFELIVWPTLQSSRHPASMHAAYTWAIHDALSKAGISNAAPQLDLRVQRLFGREDDAALRALRLLERPSPRELHVQQANAPNDAATAVLDDAKRDANSRLAHERDARRKVSE